jgi:hypothetical protein
MRQGGPKRLSPPEADWILDTASIRKMGKATQQSYHIARIITWLPRGGIERRLVAVLPWLNKPPFRVSLVCIRERGP